MVRKVRGGERAHAPREVVAMSLICPVTDVASGELMDVQRKMHMLSTNA